MNVKKVYNRSRFDEVLKPYVEDNVRQGFPQLNSVPFCCELYPDLAPELKHATVKLRDTATLKDGEYHFNDDAIRTFTKAWKRCCKRLREFHAKVDPKYNEYKLIEKLVYGDSADQDVVRSRQKDREAKALQWVLQEQQRLGITPHYKAKD